MKIDILCVGKIKESFYRDALAEYQKRLSKYVKMDIFEVDDEKTPDNPSPVEKEAVLEKEAKRLLGKIKEDALLVTLEISGKKLDSVAFANWIEQAGINGKSHIQFVIGGSLGLHSSITKKSNLSLSFSDMTFPHQLMRVILGEQIYRAYRIIQKEPYHK